MSASSASLRNSSNTSILFLAIEVASFIVVVDEDDPMATFLHSPRLLLHHFQGHY